MNHLLGYDAIQLPGIPSPFLHALIVIGITCAVMSPSATFMGAALYDRRRGIGIVGAAIAGPCSPETSSVEPRCCPGLTTRSP